MYKSGVLPASYKYLFLILVPIIMVSLLVACQERRAATGSPDEGEVPSATDKPPRASELTRAPSQDGTGMVVNRIAYVGSDGNLFTVKPDGTDSRRLTTNDLRAGIEGHILVQGSTEQILYAWPTWSPDNSRLAASRVTVDGARILLSLDVIDALDGNTTRVYDNEPGSVIIARGTPHYMYWSPDGNQLAFMAATTRDLALFISTPDETEAPTRLLGQGPPIYFSWASDSSRLLIHRRSELLLASRESGTIQPPESLGPVSLTFRTPALSRDAAKVVYAAEDASGAAVYMAAAKPQLSDAIAILTVDGLSDFMWSPTRDEVAIVDSVGANEPSYNRLTIVSDGGGARTPLVDEPLLAFFWSPDGEKIAYVAFDPDRHIATWKFVHRSGGEPVKLVDFSPSSEFLTLINFFDQYAYSSSIWSPDSAQIVFSGTIGPAAPGGNGSSPDVDKVYVIDVREGAAPREIATSRFAVWSWK